MSWRNSPPTLYRPHPSRLQKVATAPFPRLSAHRGLSQACPENTLPAFAAALAAGTHEIEFDLRPSRDGIPVVCHDETLDRTTNGQGKINKWEWSDLRQLDAGTHHGEYWTGVPLPRLEEILEFADGRVGMNIHLKDPGVEGLLIRKTCDLIMQYGLTDTAYLALGSKEALQWAFDYAPEIQRACLVRQNEPEASIAVALKWKCHRVQFFRQVTEQDISHAHESGLLCNLFWSDQPDEARNYVDMGIDVVLTNTVNTLVGGGFTPFK